MENGGPPEHGMTGVPGRFKPTSSGVGVVARWRGLLVAIVVCLTTVQFAAPSLAQADASREKVREGIELYSRNLNRGALKAFAEAIKLDPGNPAAHFMLAETYVRLGRLNDAVTHYRRTIETGAGTAFAEKARSLLPAVEEEAKARRAEAAKRKKEERQLKARLRDLDRQAKQARLTTRPGAVFRDCDVCPEMVVIPAGSFMMGSNSPVIAYASPLHRVSISNPFAVGKFEVTFAEWDACVAKGGCGGYRPDDEGWGRGRRPVINVSWHDAMQYVAWLSRLTGRRYRLLSEAEWEYVVQAGSSTPYRFDNVIEQIGDYAWSEENSNNQPHPVGQKKANAFGVHDMLGNVSEWVQDCWHDRYDGAPADGSPWGGIRGSDCDSYVSRGGNWSTSPVILNFHYRNEERYRPPFVYRKWGFRVAQTLD